MIDVKDLAGFSEPAKVLIERCSDALGAIAHPSQIIRIAKAESQAALIKAHNQIEIDKIKTEGSIEIAEIQERALARLIYEESKKQKNIENIISKALPQVKENAKPNDIEEDWMSNFFDKCRLVSDEEMQFLWGKILAGEANEPGAFSKRTVSLLQEIDKKEAVAFRSLCNFSINPKQNIVLIYDHQDEVYSTHGINFTVLKELQALNLLTYTNFGFSKKGPQRYYRCQYFNKDFIIYIPENKTNAFKTGHVLLTRIGEELSQLCDTSPIEGFEEYLLKKWEELGYTITLVDPSNFENVNKFNYGIH